MKSYATLRLLEDGPKLGGSALGCAVGKVEDYHVVSQHNTGQDGRGMKHTLLNAVLLGGTLSGVGDAVDALVKVVLDRGALLRLAALCSCGHRIVSIDT